MKKSPLLILFTTVFLDLLGFGLILPLLPVYIQHYGGTPQVGGCTGQRREWPEEKPEYLSKHERRDLCSNRTSHSTDKEIVVQQGL